MPLFREFLLGDVPVAVWKITETADELLSQSPIEYKDDAMKLRNGQRRAEWLAVRKLLNIMCGPNARIIYEETGKPLLSGCGGYVSVSHTHGYALLAYSPDKPIGVDVELLCRDASIVAHRFMNVESAVKLSDADAKTKILAYWCFCEALFKLVGNIGGTYKDNIVVKSFEHTTHGRAIISITGLSPEFERDYSVDYVNDGTLFIALCRESLQ